MSAPESESIPPSIGDIFADPLHPEARFKVDKIDGMPKEYLVELLERTTLHVVTILGDGDDRAVTPHVAGLSETDWLAAPGTQLKGKLLGIFADLSRTTSSDMTRPINADELASRRSHKVEKALKKLRARDPDPTCSDKKLMLTYAERGQIEAFRVDAMEPASLTEQINILSSEDIRLALNLPDTMRRERAYLTSWAELLAQRCRLQARTILGFLDDKLGESVHTQSADDPKSFTHGAVLLEPKEAAVIYALQAYGLPAVNITPSSEALLDFPDEEDPDYVPGPEEVPYGEAPDSETYSLTAQLERKRLDGLMALHDIVVEPTSRALMKVMAGHELTDNDVSEHILAALFRRYGIGLSRTPNPIALESYKLADMHFGFSPEDAEQLLKGMKKAKTEYNIQNLLMGLFSERL